MDSSDPFEALDSYAELVRLYRKDGLTHLDACRCARGVLEGFLSGFGAPLPSAAAPALPASPARLNARTCMRLVLEGFLSGFGVRLRPPASPAPSAASPLPEPRETYEMLSAMDAAGVLREVLGDEVDVRRVVGRLSSVHGVELFRRVGCARVGVTP